MPPLLRLSVIYVINRMKCNQRLNKNVILDDMDFGFVEFLRNLCYKRLYKK